MVDNLIYEVPKWLTSIIAAVGGIVFIYFVVQVINFFLLRERKKILLLIRKDLKRIEEKVDKLRKR